MWASGNKECHPEHAVDSLLCAFARVQTPTEAGATTMGTITTPTVEVAAAATTVATTAATMAMVRPRNLNLKLNLRRTSRL